MESSLQIQTLVCWECMGECSELNDTTHLAVGQVQEEGHSEGQVFSPSSRHAKEMGGMPFSVM